MDTGHSFTAYFKRATAPLVVLALLRNRDMYGYEVAAEMKARSHGKYTISVLYPVLYRLEKQGYLETTETTVVDGRARSYYHITEAGRMYLSRTLEEYDMISNVFRQLIQED